MSKIICFNQIVYISWPNIFIFFVFLERKRKKKHPWSLAASFSNSHSDLVKCTNANWAFSMQTGSKHCVFFLCVKPSVLHNTNRISLLFHLLLHLKEEICPWFTAATFLCTLILTQCDSHLNGVFTEQNAGQGDRCYHPPDDAFTVENKPKTQTVFWWGFQEASGTQWWIVGMERDWVFLRGVWEKCAAEKPEDYVLWMCGSRDGIMLLPCVGVH